MIDFYIVPRVDGLCTVFLVNYIFSEQSFNILLLSISIGATIYSNTVSELYNCLYQVL